MKTLAKLLSRHCDEILHKLVNDNIDFCILCQIENVDFNPRLPKEIMDSLSQIAMFVLSGFTLESVHLDREVISFEAGFGKQNIASLVTIEYKNILQITTRLKEGSDGTIFINIFALEDSKNDIDSSSTDMNEEDLIDSSRDAILSNPKNKLN